MSSTKKSSFEILPVEILYQIYDELDTETILFSMRCVSKTFYLITKNYDRVRLDFRYVSRFCMRVMGRLIDPKNVISLILSDNIETYAQIQLFHSHFLIDKFNRLRSLTLTSLSLGNEDMNKFHKYITNCSLTTVSITINDSGFNSEITKDFLISILLCNTLRTLKLGIRVEMIANMQWPIQCKVENIAILSNCNWDAAYLIISHSPQLRKFVLHDFSEAKTIKNIVMEPDMNQCDHLTSFSLCIDSNITMDDMKLLLAPLPKLTYLRLTCSEYGAHSSLLDGSRWERLIEKKLPLLNQFEFHLIHISRGNVDYPTVKSLIKPFQSPFWLEIKHLIVKCDEEGDKYSRTFDLYSIPTSRHEFDYSRQGNRTINSMLNITDNNQPIIVNTTKLILNLNQIMTENIHENTNLTTPYIFQKVTELELLINEKWLINSMEHLSRAVNLLNLQTVYLNFKCDCNFTASLNAEMEVLFKQALNLRSIRIMCNNYKNMTLLIRDDSEELKLITPNTIALRLPRHIKQLDIEVKNLNDVEEILRHGKHLSCVKFRPPDKGLDFMQKIEWLASGNSDRMCRKDWCIIPEWCDCCNSVGNIYVWLDNKHN